MQSIKLQPNARPSQDNSALQHFLYCPRQCALIHNEQVWAENRFTAEGQQLHKKANVGPDEHRASGSIFRQLRVSSKKYNLTGICDIVEQDREGILTPVEYRFPKKSSSKLGRKKKQDQITHPFLNEKMTLGLLPHIQARLLARHLRGDLDAYPAFLHK